MTKRLLVPINAVTATTTSEPISIKNAKKITALFTRANHSSGNTVFKLQGSIDGTTYVDLPLVTFTANAITEGLTRVLSVTLSSNASQQVVLEDLFCGLQYIKAVATETTDGTHTVKLLIEDELVS